MLAVFIHYLTIGEQSCTASAIKILRKGFHKEILNWTRFTIIDEVRSENHQRQSDIASSSCRSAFALGENHYFGAFRHGRNRPRHNRLWPDARRPTIWAQRIYQPRARGV